MKHALKFVIPVFVITLVGCDNIPGFGKKTDPVEAENMARSKPDAGSVQTVTVTAQGRGPTAMAAADQAIRMAIAQVNGKSVDSYTEQAQAGMTVSAGKETLDISSSGFAEVVASRTKGVVTGFKVLKQKTDSDTGIVDISIEATITKFERPESAKRLSVAVAPLRTSTNSYTIDRSSVNSRDIAGEIRTGLITTLTKTGRVNVLDRDFEAEVDAELDRITGGKVAKEETARLGQQLAADYVLVGRIDSFGYQRQERSLRMSNKTLVSHSGGAQVSFRLINIATGQTEMTDEVNIGLPSTEPTTLGTSVNVSRITYELVERLSDYASKKVVMHLFPITVVSLEGKDVVLSQGGNALVQGAFYEVMLRGKQVFDPQTGQPLGRVEKPCCVVEVTRVTPEMSYGHIASSQIDVAAAFAPGALELSGNVVPPPSNNMLGSAPAPAESAPAPAQKPRDKPAPKKAEATPTQQPAAPKDSNW